MITRTSVHAIMALVELASLPPGVHAGASAIAGAIAAPGNYLGKLLQNLRDQGLVASQKGHGGGYRLARAPESISLYDVVEPLEHVSRWNGCFLGRSVCSDADPCPIHARWQRLRGEYLGFLRETSIADLLIKHQAGEVPDLAG